MADLRRVGRRAFLRLGGLLLAVVAIAAIVYEVVFWYNHVYEPNARVTTDFTVLTARADGTIDRFHVARRDRVAAGDLLASMDTAVAELTLATLEADLAVESADRDRIEAERIHFAAHLERRIDTERDALRLLAAERDVRRARLDLARVELERVERLIGRGTATEQRRDEARDKLLDLTAEVHALTTRMQLHESRIDELIADRLREDVFRTRIAAIDRRIDRIDAAIAKARRELRDMHVYSPVAGIVNEAYANPGQFVEEADTLLLLHDPESMRVEAHIDEYDIRHVQVGQRVLIELDAYPWEKLPGEVTAVGAVALSAMSEHAGRAEYVAGSQRIPVMIRFLDIDRPIWPGSRASVSIYIR